MLLLRQLLKECHYHLCTAPGISQREHSLRGTMQRHLVQVWCQCEQSLYATLLLLKRQRCLDRANQHPIALLSADIWGQRCDRRDTLWLIGDRQCGVETTLKMVATQIGSK